MSIEMPILCQRRGCVHYWGSVGPLGDAVHQCDAFPLGIPETIVSGGDLHIEPVEGDEGIVFEPGAPIIIKSLDVDGFRTEEQALTELMEGEMKGSEGSGNWEHTSESRRGTEGGGSDPGGGLRKLGVPGWFTPKERRDRSRINRIDQASEEMRKAGVAKVVRLGYLQLDVEGARKVSHWARKCVREFQLRLLDSFETSAEDNAYAYASGSGKIIIGKGLWEAYPDRVPLTEQSTKHSLNLIGKRAAVLHEMGHALEFQMIKDVLWEKGTASELYPSSLKWGFLKITKTCTVVSPTGRGMDDWGECFAESFALWVGGRKDLVNPEIGAIIDGLRR